MKDGYPRSLADIPTWATENRVSVDETRLRFAQYGISPYPRAPTSTARWRAAPPTNARAFARAEAPELQRALAIACDNAAS
jgi:hypothetical protein